MNNDTIITWFIKHNQFNNKAMIEDYLLFNEYTQEEQTQFYKRYAEITEYRKKLAILKQQPLIEQRSVEWHNLRKNLLTASDLAQALNLSKFGNREALLNKKAGITQDTFNGNIPPLKWGTMYEQAGMQCYQSRNMDIHVHEFGLIPHPKLKVFGASPDGITDAGIMVEMKCPWRRKIIHGEVPEQYMLQIQGQLEVCDLNECDYVECTIAEYNNEFEYIEKTDKSLVEHGIILEYENLRYEYSPVNITAEASIKWMDKFVEDYTNKNPNDMLCKIHYWKLVDINIVKVYRDKKLFKELTPKIEQFWKDVIDRRDGISSPIETKAKRVKKDTKDPDVPTKAVKFMFEDD